MTVKYIRTTFLSIPFTNPPRWSVNYNRPREILVVEIETASGVTGMDYLMVLSGGLRTIQACIEELVAPVVLGRSIGSVEAIWQDILQATYWSAAWASASLPDRPSTSPCGMPWVKTSPSWSMSIWAGGWTKLSW